MIIEKKESWKILMEEGDDFLTTVNKGQYNKKLFSSIIIYNLTLMAIVKYFLAFLVYNKTVPINYNLSSMINTVMKITTIPKDIHDMLLFMCEFEEISVSEDYSRKIPDEEDIPRIVTTGDLVKKFIAGILPDYKGF